MTSSVSAWRERLHVFALDVGTPRINRAERGFAWARSPTLGGVDREWSGKRSATLTSPGVMQGLVDAVVASLQAGHPVALGFECPTYIPVHAAVDSLGGGRSFDGSRAWSANAGALVMASGMAQTAWILSALARNVTPAAPSTTFAWAPFREGRAQLLLWEAFISGASKTTGSKRSTHADDADLAVSAFRSAIREDDAPPGVRHDDVKAPRVFNWLASTGRWAGLTLVSDPHDLDPTASQSICVGPRQTAKRPTR